MKLPIALVTWELSAKRRPCGWWLRRVRFTARSLDRTALTLNTNSLEYFHVGHLPRMLLRVETSTQAVANPRRLAFKSTLVASPRPQHESLLPFCRRIENLIHTGDVTAFHCQSATPLYLSLSPSPLNGLDLLRRRRCLLRCRSGGHLRSPLLLRSASARHLGCP